MIDAGNRAGGNVNVPRQYLILGDRCQNLDSRLDWIGVVFVLSLHNEYRRLEHASRSLVWFVC